MEENTPWWQLASSYSLWLITSALGLVDFYLAWNAVRIIAATLGADQWTFPLIQRTAMIFLAVVWIVLFFGIEAWYRKAAQTNWRQLLKIFAWVTGGQIVFIGLVLILMTF